MSDDLNHWRNRLAVPLANWILNHIATPGYRLRVDVMMREGLHVVYSEAMVRRAAMEELARSTAQFGDNQRLLCDCGNHLPCRHCEEGT